ncbi:MAG: flagellar biosynthesis protein FliQ [Lachnospiraceae bacterium]|nr:flagellar biosynthesis protein FliQ [Lachnospiraceae bacterium]
MSVDTVTSIIREALYTIIISAAPMLLVSLVVGLLVSIFQTVTSIQEQTLTFVPKILSIFAVLMLVGHWIANNITSFTASLWNNFSLYIR